MRKALIFLAFFSCSNLFALPNPASFNCGKIGGELLLIQQTGICLFKDNTYCEEWALMRGQCRQGLMKFPGNYNEQTAKTFCVRQAANRSIVVLCQ